MSYLEPPPYPAPVIVQKDVGGFVADYKAATERYRAENREVQLHECRSACTLALSLPGVCVFPTSVLKFHKAYDVNTKIADEGISEELFKSYPAVVQAKLGTLTRSYKVLTGAELIALGMRNCAENRIEYARRTGGAATQVAAARPAAPAAPASSGDPGIGGVFESVLTAMAKPFEAEPGRQPVAPGSEALAAAPSASLAVPLPPRRPADLPQMELAALETPAAEPAASRVEASDPPVPLPLPRPVANLPRPTLPVPGLPHLMSGAQGVLPSSSFSLPLWAGR